MVNNKVIAIPKVIIPRVCTIVVSATLSGEIVKPKNNNIAWEKLVTNINLCFSKRATSIGVIRAPNS